MLLQLALSHRLVPLNPIATWYAEIPNNSGIGGHCSFTNSTFYPYYGAISSYNSSMCGVCVEVTGPKGTLIIPLVDECPPAQDGHCLLNSNDIDLSPQAFDIIVADHNGPTGTGNISWMKVACPYANAPVTVETRGCNQWYAKLVIGKHKNPINKVEIKNGANWYNLTRTIDNGWVSNGGLSVVGNTEVRITDIFNEVITVSGVEIASSIDKSFAGSSNFTGCLTTSVKDNKYLTQVNYYPNPSADYVVFENVSNVQKIDVYNLVGELVYSELYHGTSSKVQMNTANLATGSYLFKVSDATTVIYSNMLVKM